MSINNCHWWETKADGKETRKHNVCFSGVSFSSLKSFRYVARLEGGLTEEHATWWIAFCATFLTDLKWTAQVLDFEGSKQIEWTITPHPKSDKHTLMYASTFRMPDEFHEMVKTLYDERDKLAGDSHALFKRMQELWHPHVGTHQSGCHGLVNWGGYGGCSSKTPLTLDEFRSNLKSTRGTVHEYFAAPLPAKAAPAAVEVVEKAA